MADDTELIAFIRRAPLFTSAAMEQLFYSRDGKTIGPIELIELEAMIARDEIKSDVPIWASGMSDWSTLRDWKKRLRERAKREAQSAPESGSATESETRGRRATRQLLLPDEVLPEGSTIPPRRTRLGYGVGLLVTAALAALVPILYLLAAFVIARWSWQYFEAAGGLSMNKMAASGSVLSSSTRLGFMFRLIYYLPAITGGAVSVFMVFALIGRKSGRDRPMLMNPASQPRLQEVIERLCLAIGSPLPRRIELCCEPNAAAALAKGPGGWILGRVVLVIGLPLAATLDVRQFIGVLAHEFGHFTQGSGMRLTAFVRTLNSRMADAAWEETQLDEYLTHALTDGWAVVSIPVAGIKAGIGIARFGLRLLVRANHTISCVLLRQMEFHADQTEAQVAGSDAMVQSFARLQVVHAVFRQFHFEAAFSNSLPPNLPRYLEQEAAKLAPEDVQYIVAVANAESARWSSTHPSDRARIAAATALAAPGIVTCEAPASELFDHFHDLSRALTESYYRDHAAVWAMTRGYVHLS